MTASALANTSILAEFTGGAQSEIAMMIGVGVVKDSDAVFFQYLGDKQPPQALDCCLLTASPHPPLQRDTRWYRGCRQHR